MEAPMAGFTLSDVRPLAMVETCSIFDIARAFGQHDREIRSLVPYVQARVDTVGFPPPIMDLVKGQPSRAVTPKSRWLRSAVLAWFEGSVPPDTASRANAYDVRNAERTLAARASHLKLVGGRHAA
jgi:hypothetical protein